MTSIEDKPGRGNPGIIQHKNQYDGEGNERIQLAYVPND
jgi:hypothetical protein